MALQGASSGMVLVHQVADSADGLTCVDGGVRYRAWNRERGVVCREAKLLVGGEGGGEVRYACAWSAVGAAHALHGS